MGRKIFPRGFAVSAAALPIVGLLWIGCGPQAELILPGQGISSVSIGDEGEKVIAALGEPEDRSTQSVVGKESLVMEYYIYPSKGIDVFLENGEVKTIFLYGQGAEDHQRFSGRTPGGIDLASSRAEVLERMGPPDRKLEGELAERLYDYDDGLEISFRADDTIHHFVVKPTTP